MSEHQDHEGFAWNNPALQSLHPCDVAEIAQLLDQGLSPSDVVATLKRREWLIRRFVRNASAGGSDSASEISLLGEPSKAEDPSELARAFPPDFVKTLIRVYNQGVNRFRLAQLFRVHLTTLAEILPAKVEVKVDQPNSGGMQEVELEDSKPAMTQHPKAAMPAPVGIKGFSRGRPKVWISGWKAPKRPSDD